jgi:tetratricopeptide (TPR) repeat protein
MLEIRSKEPIMDLPVKIRFNFHDDTSVSIQIETAINDEDLKFVEIAAAACYMIGRMDEIDKSDPEAVPFRILNNKADFTEYVLSDASRAFRLVSHSNDAPSRQLVLKSRFTDTYFTFTVDQRGLRFFAPHRQDTANEIFTLLKYLMLRRIDDQDYLESLAMTFRFCARLHIGDSIPSLVEKKFHIPVMIATVSAAVREGVGSSEYYGKFCARSDFTGEGFKSGLLEAWNAGLPYDYSECWNWYRPIIANNPEIQNNIGVMYLRAEDYTGAYKCFRKSAKRGSVTAYLNLGVLHENGWGVPKDNSKAAEWFQKAAEQEDR